MSQEPIAICSHCRRKNRIPAGAVLAKCGHCRAPFSDFEIRVAQARTESTPDPDPDDEEEVFDEEANQL